jgi:hypothetical protein
MPIKVPRVIRGFRDALKVTATGVAVAALGASPATNAYRHDEERGEPPHTHQEEQRTPRPVGLASIQIQSTSTANHVPLDGFVVTPGRR